MKSDFEKAREHLKGAIKMYIDASVGVYTIHDISREIVKISLEIFNEKRKGKMK